MSTRRSGPEPTAPRRGRWHPTVSRPVTPGLAAVLTVSVGFLAAGCGGAAALPETQGARGTAGVVLTRTTPGHLVVLDLHAPPDAPGTQRLALHVYDRDDGLPVGGPAPSVTLVDPSGARATALTVEPVTGEDGATVYTATAALAAGDPFTLRVVVGGEPTEFAGTAS